MAEFNNHHTQFYKAIHESQNDLRRLRRDPRLIVSIETGAHNELHRNVAMVPPLPMHMAGRALANFWEYGDAGDPIDNLQNYMRSIEKAAKHPKAKELEKTIAETAVWACEMQIPWIQQGYINLDKYRAYL